MAIIAVGIIIYFISANRSQAPTVGTGANTTSNGTALSPATNVGVKPPTASKTTSVPAVTKDGIYIVSYLSSGFKPQTLEIKRGTTVRFTNNSTKAMRIASFDPANSQAPQSLSQPKTVGKGGVYEYTFNDAGSFGYANMNNSADRGTVTVK